MLAMLEWQIRLSRMDQRFREKGWDGRQVGKGLYHGEIRGKTLGILGYGHIGREIAKRASAFEMRILGIRRKEESKPEFLDCSALPRGFRNYWSNRISWWCAVISIQKPKECLGKKNWNP